MLQLFIILIALSLGCCVYAQQPKYVINGQAQGTTYSIQYFAPQQFVEKADIDFVLQVIDSSMSLYRDSSLINTFNKGNSKSIRVDKPMKTVLRKSFDVYKRSNGYFDITVEPLVRLWGFGAERVTHPPTQAQIDSILAFVGMDKLTLTKDVLTKTDGRLSIDLNGIAQGYSVDVLAQLLEDNGIKNYLVELGGEIRTKGAKENDKPFEIAIERPTDQSDFILQLKNRSVTTSGNYRKTFDYEGRKIHHHIDPKTGYPLQNNVASVTVIAPTAMEADAYDNVFMALSPEEGLRLAATLKDIDIYIIYKEGMRFKEAFSAGFARYIKN